MHITVNIYKLVAEIVTLVGRQYALNYLYAYYYTTFQATTILLSQYL